MNFETVFILNNFMLAAGLAMDAFSVCLADSLNEPFMEKDKLFTIAFTFSLFQGIMPLCGWFCVNSFIRRFSFIHNFIPRISFISLSYIGYNMLSESCEQNSYNLYENMEISFSQIIMQGIATSIDAFSVGFTLAEYDLLHAYISACIISSSTLVICFCALFFGRKFGCAFSGKAGIIGGLILIFIGIEIFTSNLFFG